MKNTILKILKIVIPLGIGIYLTWYFWSGLSQKDKDDTVMAFYEADYFWVLLSLIAAFLSHLSRAYRWLFQLEPLGYKVNLWNAYHAVMSGYVINYTVPRSGEFARAGLLGSAEKVPFEKGFATIVVERVIDVIMLGLIVFVTGILQQDADKFNEITDTKTGSSSVIIYVIIGGLICMGLGFLAMRLNSKFRNFVVTKLLGFWEGLKVIWTMKKKWAYIAHTLFIWSCYVGMIWISAQAFEETKNLEVGAIFGAFVVGAAAIALLPGGIGAYPTWVNAVLVLYGVHFPAYGIFVWVTQTGLIVVLGLISLFLIQRKIAVGK